MRRARPPGLPHGKVRTAIELLRNPDMLAQRLTLDVVDGAPIQPEAR